MRQSVTWRSPTNGEGGHVSDSVYKVIELIGVSDKSWEQAAAAAIAEASRTLRDLRIAEVSQLDVQIENGAIKAYRAKVKLSFKYDKSDPAEAYFEAPTI
jgi:flavin-binding protein dodecin